MKSSFKDQQKLIFNINIKNFSEAGLQQFTEFGGIGVLRNFCVKLESPDKCWDRLLCRACNVLSQCSVSKPLPLEQESGPLVFALPKDCQNIVVDGKTFLTFVYLNKIMFFLINFTSRYLDCHCLRLVHKFV